LTSVPKLILVWFKVSYVCMVSCSCCCCCCG